jgi:tRNA 5-methylaminomethyl-2-thiouridine biosynthesis bifunctional protein
MTAPARAPRVFLQGHGLPQRWAGRPHFVVLVAGFGAGEWFLALWDAWRQDPARCAHLHVVAIEPQPLAAADLAGAQADSPVADLAVQLQQAWPPATRNLHLLDFEQGRVQLTLAFGDLHGTLRALRLSADSIGLGPWSSPSDATGANALSRTVKALARLAAPGATLVADDTSPPFHASLRAAGFQLQAAPVEAGDRATTHALWAPTFMPRRVPNLAVQADTAVVVGAGLAGAAVAQALARQGLRVTVLEQADGPASGASGNPAGLFHGTVHGDDGPYARLFRACALAAQATYRQVLAGGQVAGLVHGLLRVADAPVAAAELRRRLQSQSLPESFLQLLDTASASALAGVPLPGPCWLYPGGGWVSPPDVVRAALQTPGVSLHTQQATHAISRCVEGWQVQDAAGAVLAQAPLLVLCHAAGAQRLLQSLGPTSDAGAWPLRQSRGQVTYWTQPGSQPLQLPVAGDGYALPLPGALLCGATRQEDDSDPAVRAADHRHNLARLQRLTGLQPPDGAALQGRVGWRLHTDDRLPIAGAVPALRTAPGTRLDQARLLPREKGLFVLTALGARGLTLAPLLARLVAAQATGTPWPLEQDLADAVDPGRWIVRAARRAGAQG